MKTMQDCAVTTPMFEVQIFEVFIQTRIYEDQIALSKCNS